MPVRRFVVWLGAVAFAASAVAIIRAQSTAQPAGTPPQFRSGVALLRLDASVVDDSGRAVGDLKPDDFRVTIDGQPRKVLFARFTGTAGTSAPSPAAAPLPSYAISTPSSGGRAIVVMIDLESIRAGHERALLDTAAQLIERLRPIDAAAVVPLPGASVDLTRDHRRVADAIRGLRGTNQIAAYNHSFTLDEALAFERQDKRVIDEVLERECSLNTEVARGRAGLSPLCPPEISRDTKDRLAQERLHIQTVLASVVKVANQLKTVQAPASIVLISGGLGFEQGSLGRFNEVQLALKEAGVAIATVQVDQMAADAAATRASETAFYSTRDRESGLANVATMSGGVFYPAVARAKGVFERLRTEISEAYELGVEPAPGDLDGKSHEIKVTTTRKAEVRARRFVIAQSAPTDPAAYLANLIAQPVDVGDLPIAIAAHSVRGDEATTLKVMIRADIGHGVTTAAPVRYQAVVIGEKGNADVNVTGNAASDGSVLLTTQLAPGRYRVRLAAIEGGGRTGTFEVPIVAGLRSVGGYQLGDLIVGTMSGQSLAPSIYASTGSPLIPTLEMTTADSARFAQTSVGFEVRRSGSDDVVATGTGRLEQTQYDRQQIARGSVPTSELAPGEYTLSAIIKVDSQPAGRVSRTFVLEPGAARPVTAATAAPAVTEKTAEAPPAAPAKIADPIVDDAMHKAASYVASYGEKMSVVVGVEKYIQNINPTTTGVPPLRPRQIVAEFALVKSGGAVPWTGYRDVIEVNGDAVTDRRDRIVKILTESADPLQEAAKLTAESARFNVGPVSRNFNIPTSALFFFHESNLSRFTFTSKGTKKIDGIDTLEIAFKETAQPTLITTRAGKNVPAEGTIWVLPADGAIVRTRLQLKGFSDLMGTGEVKTSSGTPARVGLTGSSAGGGGRGSTAGDPNSNVTFGGQSGLPDLSPTSLQSTAEIEVTYRRDEKLGMWLPAQMTEEYQGQIPMINRPAIPALARSKATYSDYKQFGTSSTVIGVKK